MNSGKDYIAFTLRYLYLFFFLWCVWLTSENIIHLTCILMLTLEFCLIWNSLAHPFWQIVWQLLDLPGIIEGAKDGKGRGRQVKYCICNFAISWFLYHHMFYHKKREIYFVRNLYPRQWVLKMNCSPVMTNTSLEDTIKYLCTFSTLITHSIFLFFWLLTQNEYAISIFTYLEKLVKLYIPNFHWQELYTPLNIKTNFNE